MKLFKSISIYAVSNISKQAVAFLLLPVITHYLSKEQNGDLSTITAIVSMLSPLVILSIHGAINIEFFRQDQGKENFASYLSSAIINPLGIFILLTCVTFIFGSSLADWLNLAPFWIHIIPLLCIFSFIPVLTSVIFQAQQQPIKHSIYNISFTLIDLSISVFLIVQLSMNWEGRIFASLSAKALYSVIGIYILYRSGFLTTVIKKKYIKDALFFGLPLIPHIISAGVMDLSDRLFVREMVGREELGIYDIGYKIGSVISILQASLMLAWSPFLYQKLKALTEENKILITSISYLLLFGLFISALVLTFLAPFIFDWFIGESYAGGIKYVFWVAMSYVFLGAYKMFSIFLFYSKKTAILSYVAVFNTITNLLLNYFLINAYGAIGAAYATLISFFLFFLIIAFISNRIYPMPWLAFGQMFRFIQLKIKEI